VKKLLVLILIVIVAPLLAALYGALHDQLTYTISPEYYTKFKFFQFELTENKEEAILPNPRLAVAVVGVMATLQAFALTIVVAFLTGLIGLCYGYYDFANGPGYFMTAWRLPENLIDVKNFVAVGSMHNFSYIGGATGLLAAIYFSVRRRLRGEGI
jgi:hypothetical protein